MKVKIHKREKNKHSKKWIIVGKPIVVEIPGTKKEVRKEAVRIFPCPEYLVGQIYE